MKIFLSLLVMGTAFLIEEFTIFADSPAPFSSAQSVSFADMPEAVQRTLKSNAGTSEIENVRSNVINGNTIYRGTFQKNGTVKDMFVSSDGSIYNPPQRIGWNQLPSAVQETFRSMSHLADLREIVVRTTEGQPVYEFFVNNSGQIASIQLAQNGTLVGIKSGAPLPVGAIDLAWHEIPAEVQSTFLAQAGEANFVSATRTTANGQMIYNIVMDNGGQRSAMRIAREGLVLSGGTISEAAGAQRVRDELTFDQLPVAAQTTVMAITGEKPIEGIRKVFVQGQVCYEIDFRERGQPIEACVSETGKIIK